MWKNKTGSPYNILQSSVHWRKHRLQTENSLTVQMHLNLSGIGIVSGRMSKRKKETGYSIIRRIRTNVYLFPALKPPPARALFQDLALILRVFTTFPRWLVLWVRAGAAPGHHTRLVREAAANSRPNSSVTISSAVLSSSLASGDSPRQQPATYWDARGEQRRRWRQRRCRRCRLRRQQRRRR